MECPNCGSDEVRLSRRPSALGRALHLFGVYRFRCESCQHLFRSRISKMRYVFYAKCPCCHRMDLSRWSRDYYNPPTLTRWMLALGADPIRCEYCRHNFWSFRWVREKFCRQKRAARSQVVIPTSDSADQPVAIGREK